MEVNLEKLPKYNKWNKYIIYFFFINNFYLFYSNKSKKFKWRRRMSNYVSNLTADPPIVFLVILLLIKIKVIQVKFSFLGKFLQIIEDEIFMVIKYIYLMKLYYIMVHILIIFLTMLKILLVLLIIFLIFILIIVNMIFQLEFLPQVIVQRSLIKWNLWSFMNTLVL